MENPNPFPNNVVIKKGKVNIQKDTTYAAISL
jgi:hypothetical protein